MKKKPTGLDPKKVAASKISCPHARLSPTMGAKPSPLQIADEMNETLGPSKAALEDAVKLQYNMVDLFNMGEVQMPPSLRTLFRWKDARDAATRVSLYTKLITVLTSHKELLNNRIDIGRPVTWGIYNAAIRAAMASLKEGRERKVMALEYASGQHIPIGPGNIGFVRVLMDKDYAMDKPGWVEFQTEAKYVLP